MTNHILNLKTLSTVKFRKNISSVILAMLFGILLSSCYAPLSSSKASSKATKKLYTHNHRKSNAAKFGVMDNSVDCPTSTRRKQ